jgi:hypothetical protein
MYGITILILVSISDYRFRRTEDRLQEPDRPVQQPEPLGSAGIHSPSGEKILKKNILVC